LKLANTEHGVSATRFFVLKKALEEAQKVHKAAVDGKWGQIRAYSRNWYDQKDQ